MYGNFIFTYLLQNTSTLILIGCTNRWLHIVVTLAAKPLKSAANRQYEKKHCFPTTELFELNICRNLWMTLKILNSDPIINCLQSDSTLYTLFVSFGKKETLNIGYQVI